MWRVRAEVLRSLKTSRVDKLHHKTDKEASTWSDAMPEAAEGIQASISKVLVRYSSARMVQASKFPTQSFPE